MNNFNRYQDIFRAEAVYDNTVVNEFFRDVDKVVNCLRLIPNLSKIDSGFFVTYQNTVGDVVTTKLVKHGWKVTDINDLTTRLQNADGWQVEVQDVPSGSNLLTVRVLVLNQVIVPQIISPMGQAVDPLLPTV